jgi:hypothetical protein
MQIQMNTNPLLADYVRAVSELSRVLQGKDDRQRLLQVAAMIAAAAAGTSDDYPFRPGIVCRAMMEIPALNAECDGDRLVSDDLFQEYRRAIDKLAASQEAAGNSAGVALLHAAHMIVDIAIKTCSDNPCHPGIIAHQLAALDACLSVSPHRHVVDDTSN